MTKVSERFLVALRLHKLPAYRIAQRARVNPTTLSKLVNGIERIRPNDRRIIRVAKVLGLRKEEAFRSEQHTSEMVS